MQDINARELQGVTREITRGGWEEIAERIGLLMFRVWEAYHHKMQANSH